MRAGTKKKAIELCLMYAEVENGGEGIIVRHDAVPGRNPADMEQADVLAGLDAKQPKTVVGSITALKELIERVIRFALAHQCSSGIDHSA